MARVMAVSFEKHGQLHYLDPGDRQWSVGDWVLYPTDAGPEVCQVVWAPEHVDGDSDGPVELPRCVGAASEADLARDRANKARRAEAELVAKELISRHGLPMKVVGIDFVDRSAEFDEQVVVYFTAPGRVDFRGLIGDLARAVQARIDLRQVASRDAARLTGGVGSCGRELCCATWLTTFEPVSMRLARSQGLSTNPLQIQGQCGKLMCCLTYEHPLYADFARHAPPIGDRVSTPSGPGVVVGHSVPGQSVTVRTESGEVTRCPLVEVCTRSVARKQRHSQMRREAG